MTDNNREFDDRAFRRESYIYMLRSEAFSDIPAYDWRFENAKMTAELAKVKQYADKWDEVSRENIGLLLFGNVGTGKTYAAGCVANVLLDQMISVCMIGFSDVVNRMQGNFGADRENLMKHLMRAELLILDDLGAERNTSFGKECVFDVINRRLLQRKPMIVTTNISLDAMKKAPDLEERRIYDRILDVCAPICFNGENFRKANHIATKQKATDILNDIDNSSDNLN